MTVLLSKAIHCQISQVASAVRQRLAHGRMNLAYATVRSGRRLEACSTADPNLWQTPGWAALRRFASIARG